MSFAYYVSILLLVIYDYTSIVLLYYVVPLFLFFLFFLFFLSFLFFLFFLCCFFSNISIPPPHSSVVAVALSHHCGPDAQLGSLPLSGAACHDYVCSRPAELGEGLGFRV